MNVLVLRTLRFVGVSKVKVCGCEQEMGVQLPSRDLNTVRIWKVNNWKPVFSVSELRQFYVKIDHLVIFHLNTEPDFWMGIGFPNIHHPDSFLPFEYQICQFSDISVLDFTGIILVKTSLAVKCLKFRPLFIFMLVHRAWKLVRKLEGLVCYPDIMPSNQMATSVQYWALDFVYVRLWLIQ